MTTILSKFLNAGLLPIGEDDQKLALLEAAAEELAGQIAANPLLAYRCALVGFDDRVKVDDPAIKNVEEVVLRKWTTITNKVGPGPVQVYRAVLLRALEIGAADNRRVAHAVALVAQNEPSIQSRDKERDVVCGMLEHFNAIAEEEITENWIRPVVFSAPKQLAKNKKPQPGKDELAAGIARAVGPSDKDNKALNAPNPHWPNAGPPWAHEFTGRATDAIFAAIHATCKGNVDDAQEMLRETLQRTVEGAERIAMRDAKAELLWIRTSMYSPSGRTSFRSMKPDELLLHAVLDVSRTVSASAPPSVEYFLRDLVASLAPKKLKLAEALTALGPKMAALPEANSMLSDPMPASGRRSWLDVAVRPNGSASFHEQAGVQPGHDENPAELAVKLYREIQIRKLLPSVA